MAYQRKILRLNKLRLKFKMKEITTQLGLIIGHHAWVEQETGLQPLNRRTYLSTAAENCILILRGCVHPSRNSSLLEPLTELNGTMVIGLNT